MPKDINIFIKKYQVQCNGQNGLHMTRDAEKMSLLIEAGADVDRLDAEDKSPLYYAIQGGYTDCVEVLLNAGAIVDENVRQLPHYLYYMEMFEME